MVKYVMVADMTRCNACYNCQLACKDEHVENDFPPIAMAQPDSGHFWIRLEERERGQFPWVKSSYTAVPCQHCDDAPCMKVAKNNAIYKRSDGIVIIDPEKAKGMKQLVDSCPYKVIFWNEEKKLPQKCTFCAHLLDEGWKEPRCVESCPTDALVFGDADDPNSKVSKIISSGKTEILHPEFNSKPRVHYIGLSKTFIAGSVVLGDTDECAEGVRVTLTDQSTKKATKTITNNYGDFEFEQLLAGRTYLTKFELAGYVTTSREINLQTDTYLGEIILQKA